MPAEDKSKSVIRRYPYNNDAEQCLLCCMLIDTQFLDDYVDRLSDDDFFNKRHKRIYLAIKSARMGGNVDTTTVFDAMRRQAMSNEKEPFDETENLTYLTELSYHIASAANGKDYYDIVKRDSTLRSLLDNCNQIIEKAYSDDKLEDILRFAESLIYSISKKMSRSDLVHIKEPVTQLNEKLNKLMSDKNATRGLMTGYPLFDKKTNGLQKGDLIILAARPSVGKTSLALNIATQIAVREKMQKNIAIFSLEMPAVQLVQRLVCNLSDVSMNEVSSGKIEGEGIDRIFASTKTLCNTSIYIDDSSIQSPKQMLSKLRRLSSKVGYIDLVVVDYIGLMETGDSSKKNDSRQQEITYISRQLKILAKEMSCPVIVLSQMSRGIENRTDKAPKLSDLRESGAIEQDADIVMFLSREDEKLKDARQYTVLLEIAKHRNGELGKIRMDWTGEFIRFRESKNQTFVEKAAPIGEEQQ